MRLRPLLGYLRARLRTSLRASFALRGAFWMQAGLMLVNDLIWMSAWWIFFARFERVGGWTLYDLLTVHAMVAIAVGLTVIPGGGMRVLGKAISDGDLDAVLTQPKPPLLQLVMSKSDASGWGDLVHGVILLSWVGHVEPARIPLAVLGGIGGASALLSIGVLFQSLAFWLGPVDTLARQMWEFVITFALYPERLFGGPLRFVLFTFLPAAFVGWMPAALVRAFSLETLGFVLAGAVAFPLVASWVFRLGLRSYTSGNRVGQGA